MKTIELQQNIFATNLFDSQLNSSVVLNMATMRITTQQGEAVMSPNGDGFIAHTKSHTLHIIVTGASAFVSATPKAAPQPAPRPQFQRQAAAPSAPRTSYTAPRRQAKSSKPRYFCLNCRNHGLSGCEVCNFKGGFWKKSYMYARYRQFGIQVQRGSQRQQYNHYGNAYRPARYDNRYGYAY